MNNKSLIFCITEKLVVYFKQYKEMDKENMTTACNKLVLSSLENISCDLLFQWAVSITTWNSKVSPTQNDRGTGAK